MLHLLNLVMSMFSAGQFEITSQYKPNPCSFYLLNLGIDVRPLAPTMKCVHSMRMLTEITRPPLVFRS
jgi:hypothetical protein